MKRENLKKYGIYVAIVVVPLIIIYAIYSSFYEETDDAFLEANITSISARVPGYIQTVVISDNEMVKAGQVLATLDPNDYQAKLDQAKAELAIAKAESQKTASDVNRYEPLLQHDEISRQRFTHAQAEADKAKAALDAAKAKKAIAELDFSYTQILAPSDGKVTKKSAEVGAYVQAGQPLMAIVSMNPWVIANFKETQLRHMKPNDSATIRIDGIGMTLKGHVDSIQSGSGTRFSLFPPENATGNFVKIVQRVPVKIVFDENPEELSQLGPGLSVVPKVWVR